MNKEDLIKHYSVNNDDELYKLLVQEKIKELERKEVKEEVKEENSILSKNNLKNIQKSFVVSIIDIVFLIGFIFAFTFLHLLFDNQLIPVIAGLLIAIVLIILKQQHFASLLMLPIPVFIFIGGYEEFTDIGFIILSIITLGFLYYRHYSNSFYHYILSIYLIVFFMFYIDIQISSIIAMVILSGLTLISWVKFKKYFISFIYIIGVYIFSFNLIISTISIITYFGLLLILILILIYVKNSTNLIEKIFSEFVIILLNISIFIYTLLLNDLFFYSEQPFSKLSIEMLILFFIIEAYILYKQRIKDLGSYLMLNVLIVFAIPYTTIYGLFEYNDNHFIVTVISLILFFITINILEKKTEVNKLFKFIMYYLFMFSIFFKLMIIDLDGLNGFIRLTLLFVSSMIMLIVAIISYLKNKKNDKKV